MADGNTVAILAIRANILLEALLSKAVKCVRSWINALKKI